MPAYDDQIGYKRGGSNIEAVNNDLRISIAEAVIDLPVITAARAASGATALVADDEIRVLHVPAKTYVSLVGVEILRAEGVDGHQIYLGDSGDTDGYVRGADANLNTVRTVVSSNLSASVYRDGRYYPEASTIDLTLDHLSSKAKLRVFAIFVDCS